jgi:hypothetical protein
VLPSQVIPAVIGADQIVRPGVEGLRYLAKLAGTAGLPASLPDQAVDRDMAVPRLAETCHTEWATGPGPRRASAGAGPVRTCAAGSGSSPAAPAVTALLSSFYY